jgi:cyclopropane fatty-acyl-phospholipid synthase-like methyltransferase
MRRRLFFELRYLIGRAPWDTGITPPEVVEFLDRTPPGRALDIGCGTGTNAVAMARRGWSVTGLDFSGRALRAARARAAAAGLTVDFLQGDASDLRGVTGRFEYILDIGCFHALPPDGQRRYARRVAELAGPGTTYMLYTFLSDDGADSLPSRASLERLFAPAFALTRFEPGTDRQRPSAWATFVRAG